MYHGYVLVEWRSGALFSPTLSSFLNLPPAHQLSPLLFSCNLYSHLPPGSLIPCLDMPAHPLYCALLFH